MTSMTNPSKAVLLINTSARAVLCAYETGDNAKRVMFKTLDQDIDVGDLVIVPSKTRHNFTTTKVVEVDVDVDFMSPEQIDWIVAKIDIDEYLRILEMEKSALKSIRSAEMKREREKLREAMLADVDGGSADRDIARLATATIEHEVAAIPPSAPPSR